MLVYQSVYQKKCMNPKDVQGKKWRLEVVFFNFILGSGEDKLLLIKKG